MLEEVCFKAEEEVFDGVLGTFEPERKKLVRRVEDDALLLPLGLGRHVWRAPRELLQFLHVERGAHATEVRETIGLIPRRDLRLKTRPKCTFRTTYTSEFKVDLFSFQYFCRDRFAGLSGVDDTI